MKKITFLASFLFSVNCLFCQPDRIDSNYAVRVTAVEWMQDGKSFLFSLVKYHKTDRQAPFYSRIFRYDLHTRKSEVLFDNAGNLAPSPDGKTIAYMKRDDKLRTDIYLYDLLGKNESILKIDTFRKSALGWSPNGKFLLYSVITKGTGPQATLDIGLWDFAAKKSRWITQSGNYKSYNPVWSPDSRRIVYYFEKGDSHDQIWLTDTEGSFHTNLTHDTATHNYYPCWLDDHTIIYTQSPESIITMNEDGSNRKKVEGLKTFQVKFNPAAGLVAYLAEQPENKVFIYDWKKRTTRLELDDATIASLWK